MAELFNGVKEVVNGPEGTVAKNQVVIYIYTRWLYIYIYQRNSR
jgi:hypothetical protein